MNGLQRSRRTREPKPATSTATSTGSAPCAVLTSAIRAVMHDGVVGPPPLALDVDEESKGRAREEVLGVPLGQHARQPMAG